MLSPEMKEYINQLTDKVPGIKSIWLIGSRANGNDKKDSDWDFLVFGDKNVFENIRKDRSFRRENIDLLVVVDGDNFSTPFGDNKKGSLKKWQWTKETDLLAIYQGIKFISDEPDEMTGYFDRKALDAINVFSCGK